MILDLHERDRLCRFSLLVGTAFLVFFRENLMPNWISSLSSLPETDTATPKRLKGSIASGLHVGFLAGNATGKHGG
jgi:hypothetical protein